VVTLLLPGAEAAGAADQPTTIEREVPRP